MRQVQAFLVKPGHQIGIRFFAGRDFRFPPGTTPARGLAQLPQIIGSAKPEPGLRLRALQVVRPFGAGIITADDEHPLPGTEIAVNPQVR